MSDQETGVTKGTLDEGTWIRISKKDGIKAEWLNHVTLGFQYPPEYVTLQGLFRVVLKAGVIVLAAGDPDVWGEIYLTQGAQWPLLARCQQVKTHGVLIPDASGALVKRMLDVGRPDVDHMEERVRVREGLGGWDASAALDWIRWLERDVSFDREGLSNGD